MTDLEVDASAELAGAGLSEEQRCDVLALRGLLACGVLGHCLRMRHRVDFGVNRCALAFWGLWVGKSGCSWPWCRINV